MISRRNFLQSGTTVLAAGSVGLASHAGEPTSATQRGQKIYVEPERAVPIVEESDVVVCGAGPAGVAAAISAARAGARTRLLEVNGCLGGIWTAGLLCWVLDTANKPGLIQEIARALDQRGARSSRGRPDWAYDPEVMKLLLEEMCTAAGVKVQLHTRVAAAACEGDRLSLVLTESKSGRQAWAGKVFVDATGDGDLAALAGCGFDYGRPGSGETQPLSLIAVLTGIVESDIEPFIGGGPKRAETKDNLLAEMKRAGVVPSYTKPTLFRIYPNLFALMANHEYRVCAYDAAQITEATLRARAEVHRLVAALRTLGGAWSGLRIVATAEHIGVREGRRIHGLYTVSTDDLVNGVEHDDAVCRVRFPIDVHSTNPDKDKGIMNEGKRAKPYDVPFRALIARDVKGLLLAGRCISGDFLAHSSYRVTGNAVPMGEAAGVAAALSARAGKLPQEISWEEIRAGLEKIRTA